MIAQSFETILNRYLALDPESAARLSALEGKTITFDFRVIPIMLHFNIADKKIHIQSTLAEPADVIIKGTPLSLLHMSIAKSERRKFFAEDVIIEGNLELGQQVIDLFDEMEIDWEEYFSRFVGDVSAHHVGRFLRGIKKFAEQARESVLQNVNEYMHEEALMFPAKEALHDFFHDVDHLRMDVDRLAMRVQRLKDMI